MILLTGQTPTIPGMLMLRRLLTVAFCWLIAGWAMSLPASGQGTPDDHDVAGNEQVAEIIDTFEGRGVMADDSRPTPAAEAVQQFKLRDEIAIELVAAEPDISQPLFLSWDSRGRMWVVQYRQYQYPAGLRVIRYDQHLRAVFDRVPDPPPQGVAGADKITVFEDRDGDGRYDTHRDVITGLNIATSVQTGRGGIWVLNPPYLLFYPDADQDGIPDADPVVELSGFGLQDTHSVANSLTWGPDGWLYGANGSTTTGTVSSAVTKGVRFQGQCVWRFHPDSKVFEIYAEGGGNTFSLEIDRRGRVFSGTNGGQTRGWYYPQGSYAEKRWGKHGPLTNPYAFGYFPPMRFEGDGRRFPQAFCIYEGGLFPASYAGTIIAPNSLHNLVWHSRRLRDGSTFRTVDEANLLESPDRWFRPVYVGVGPDGAVYLADWYDTRLSHVSPVDDWHKQSGRIYRLQPNDSSPRYELGDLSQQDSQTLVDLFEHPNRWVRTRCVLELGWRGDESIVSRLVAEVSERASLEALWVLSIMGQLNSELAAGWLDHKDPHVRRWVARLLGDRHEGHAKLVTLAETEPDVDVRSQLAATAKRIDAATGIAVVAALLRHDEDVADPHLPLMNWWAIEAHAAAWPQIQKLVSEPGFWSRPLVQQAILARLMQRYASTDRAEDLEHCAWLLKQAPDDDSRAALLVGLNRAFQGRSLPPLPVSLETALQQHRESSGGGGLVLALRQRSADALTEALSRLSDDSADLVTRTQVARTLGEVSYPEALPVLLQLATGRTTEEAALQRVAIAAAGQYDDPAVPAALIGGFGGAISNEHGLRAAACRTLASRPEWAIQLLAEINQWRLKPDDVPADVVQQLRSYGQAEIRLATERAFGKSLAATDAEQQVKIASLRDLITGDRGEPGAGKPLFMDRCGKCHQLFGEGQKIGPPLDGYERGKVDFWLAAIVAPNLEIREGYQSYLAVMNDGRVMTGMIAAQDDRTVTLRNAENESTILSRDEIDTLRAIPTSLMPDDTLKSLSDAEIGHLFAYLMWGAGSPHRGAD